VIVAVLVALLVEVDGGLFNESVVVVSHEASFTDHPHVTLNNSKCSKQAYLGTKTSLVARMKSHRITKQD
jgi:hypothetical protein